MRGPASFMTPRSQNSDYCLVKSGNVSFQWFPAASSTSAKNPSPSSKIVSDFTGWEISTQRGHLRPLHHDGFLYQYNQWSNQCLQLAQRSRKIKGIFCPLLVYVCTAGKDLATLPFVCHTISGSQQRPSEANVTTVSPIFNKTFFCYDHCTLWFVW